MASFNRVTFSIAKRLGAMDPGGLRPDGEIENLVFNGIGHLFLQRVRPLLGSSTER